MSTRQPTTKPLVLTAALLVAVLALAASCGSAAESADIDSSAPNVTESHTAVTEPQPEATGSQSTATEPEATEPADITGLASSIDITREPDVEAWCLGWTADSFYQDGSEPAEVERVMTAILTADEQRFAVAPDEIADDQAYSLIETREFFRAHEEAAWDEDKAMAALIERGSDDVTIDAVFDRLEQFATTNCE